MVQVRKNHQTLVYGTYHLELADNEQVYAYTRTLDDKRYLVMLSFSTKKTTVAFDHLNFNRVELVVSNDDIYKTGALKRFELMPYQATIYQLF